jgi:hypothetical protein
VVISMPNPPKLDPQRGARGRGVVNLPAEGRKEPAPEWPFDTFSLEEAEAWAQLWATPQSVAWERLGWVRTVARYCRVMLAAEAANATPALLAQATAMEDRLGLTPKAMRLLLWQVVTDEVATKREQPKGTSARSRLKAVG